MLGDASTVEELQNLILIYEGMIFQTSMWRQLFFRRIQVVYISIILFGKFNTSIVGSVEN